MVCRSRPQIAACLLWSSIALAGCAAKEKSEQSNPSQDKSVSSSKAVQEIPTEADAFSPEEGFARLTREDFEVFHGKKPGAVETWTTAGGTIRCTGKPRGYLHSKKTYKNFTLRLDYRFEPPQDPASAEKANTGVLVYINGPHRLWPVCLEVQGKHVEMGHIKANGRADVIDAAGVYDDEPARQKNRKPVGEWNSLEIVSRDGALSSFLNGSKICDNKPGELREGAIGLQAEDFEVEFRRLRIREDK